MKDNIEQRPASVQDAANGAAVTQVETRNPVMVSCILLTYNHAPYVKQAIESMLAQQTTFAFEIIAADDCSTDNTREMLSVYAAQYPNIVRTCFYPENMGACKLPNLAGETMCTGKYLTLLEGDDYWVGTDRLQTLVDFLESHPDYACVAHRREARDETGTLLDYDPKKHLVNRDFTMAQFLRGERWSFTGSLQRNFYPLVGAKYRELLTLTRHVDDYQRCVMVYDFGKVYLLDRVFYAYRVIRKAGGANYNSITSDMQKYRDQMRIFAGLQAFYAEKYDFSGEVRRWQAKHLLLALLHGRRDSLREIWADVPKGRRLVTALYMPVYALKRLLKIGERSGWKKR